jgi:hypothetical protein
MSQLAVTEFLNSATTNPGLLSRIASTGAGLSPMEAGEAISALGAESGYQFSAADALAVREVVLAKSAGGEDALLDGVRGGSGSDPFLNAQINTMTDTFAAMSPNSSGVLVHLASGAAQGNLGGAAVDAANSMNETKSTVQQIFSTIFSGW